MLDMLVPCAAYGLLAAASIATVHRFLLPVSREAALALAALPLVVWGPALLAGNVLAPVDLLFATDPFAAVAAEHGVTEVRSGPLTDVNGQSLPWLAAASGALALTASAVFILPVLETIPLTWQYHHRHRVLSTEPRAVEPAAALDNLLHGVVPFQWGAVGDEVVPPRVRPPHAKPWQRWYAGSLLLVPAILGLAAHR